MCVYLGTINNLGTINKKMRPCIWNQTRRVIWEILEKEIGWEECCNNINNLKNKRNTFFKDVGLLNPLKMLRWCFERGAGPQRLLTGPAVHWHGVLAWSLEGPGLWLFRSSRVSICSLQHYPTWGKTVLSSKAATPDTDSSYLWMAMLSVLCFQKRFLSVLERNWQANVLHQQLV